MTTTPAMDALETAWLAALDAKHTTSFSRPELLKAIRALSARYVERRAELGTRSALDSAGKRAAFAVFYAPLHYFTMRELARALPVGRRIDRLIDLGCGTGTASAAWARQLSPHAELYGVDRHPWSVSETAWTWQRLGLHGRARRGDLVDEVRRVLRARRTDLTTTAVLCAWSINELDRDARTALLPILLDASERGAAVLVVEPIARSATPWWREWAKAVIHAGGRADEWRFDTSLPPRLADLDEAAGFTREGLSAKSVFLNGAAVKSLRAE